MWGMANAKSPPKQTGFQCGVCRTGDHKTLYLCGEVWACLGCVSSKVELKAAYDATAAEVKNRVIGAR